MKKFLRIESGKLVNDRSDKRMKLWKPNYGEEYYYVVVYKECVFDETR